MGRFFENKNVAADRRTASLFHKSPSKKVPKSLKTRQGLSIAEKTNLLF